MCGINGLLFKNPITLLEQQLGMMNKQIIHRGPNDAGMYCHEERIGMGMQRLAVIDIASGRQPIKNDTEDIVIVFNGEIYNYRILKQELENAGVVFCTQSDTEVVLKLYEKWGKDCLKHMNGMFAFSIHDKKNKSIFIARDRFGEKPLYYYSDAEKFTWASELKSIISTFPELKKIEKKSLHLFLSLTYIPAPFTIYEKVFKLKAGHYMLIDTETLAVDIQPYWDIKPHEHKKENEYVQAKTDLRKLVFESIEQRMIADVPLGVFLSGGVDSAIIAAVMAKVSSKKIKAFTVGSENRAYDESARAKQVASHIGAEHFLYPLQYKEMLGKLDAIVLNYDEPFADSSALPSYFIANKAVQEVTVALTGDGGDEVFGGYNKYLSSRYRKILTTYLPEVLQKKITDPVFLEKILGGRNSKSILTKAKRFLSSLQGDSFTSHLNIIALGFRQEEMVKLLKQQQYPYKDILIHELNKTAVSEFEGLKLLRYIDKEISLEGDMLAKVDRASMRCSLECRSPFLDHRLMEKTYEWPDEFLIKGSQTKRILKETFSDLLPTGFFNAPKSGFEIPVGEWLRNELKDDLLLLLDNSNLGKHGFFNTEYVQKLVTEHLQRTLDHSWKLWTLYCFQKWYRHNFN
jgi:asparagine synthase (glutamine-hydrolysing)